MRERSNFTREARPTDESGQAVEAKQSASILSGDMQVLHDWRRAENAKSIRP